jgi:hypothetical protein
MNKAQLLLASLALLVSAPCCGAWTRVGVGIGINLAPGPFYYGRPYYAPYRYYYPPPIVVGPAVVYTAPPPPPVVVQSPPVTTTVPAAPPAALLPPPTPVVQANHQGNNARCDQLLQQLQDTQETARRDAAMDLGRMHAEQAIDPLTQLLSHDQSAAVRDAAARALGLIGSRRSLTALIYAAQADQDRDVRHSAQFAIEVIRNNQSR